MTEFSPDYLVGIDEVGRGPLAGPLCVGAFLVERKKLPVTLKALRGIHDSKQLSSAERERWLSKIETLAESGSCRFSTTFVHSSSIDQQGMAKALHLAVARVLFNLAVHPAKCFVLLDGTLRAPAVFQLQESIIDGDENEPLIATASVIAKVRRDRHMVGLAKRFPEYGFEEHKGYGTRKHYEALQEYGVSEVHRKSFLRKFQFPNTNLQTISNTQIQKAQTRAVLV